MHEAFEAARHIARLAAEREAEHMCHKSQLLYFIFGVWMCTLHELELAAIDGDWETAQRITRELTTSTMLLLTDLQAVRRERPAT